MKEKSESEVTQSCPTLSDPMDYSPPDSSIHGIFQARVLECGAIAPGTNLVSQVNYTSTNKQAKKLKEKEIRFVITIGEGVGRGEIRLKKKIYYKSILIKTMWYGCRQTD